MSDEKAEDSKDSEGSEDSELPEDSFEFFRGVMDDEKINNLLRTVKLFQDDENVRLKSEVHHPFILSQLRALADFLDRRGFGKTAKVIRILLIRLLEYRVSYNRKSRDEMGDAIRGIGGKEKQEVEDKLDKLLEA